MGLFPLFGEHDPAVHPGTPSSIQKLVRPYLLGEVGIEPLKTPPPRIFAGVRVKGLSVE